MKHCPVKFNISFTIDVPSIDKRCCPGLRHCFHAQVISNSTLHVGKWFARDEFNTQHDSMIAYFLLQLAAIRECSLQHALFALHLQVSSWWYLSDLDCQAIDACARVLTCTGREIEIASFARPSRSQSRADLRKRRHFTVSTSCTKVLLEKAWSR